MAAVHRATKQPAGQGSLTEWSWPAIVAGLGAMLILSLLAPADSISVFIGTALPQNLGWLALAACAAFASRHSEVRFQPSRIELALVSGGLVWFIAATWMASARGDSRMVWNGFWQVISLGSCFYIARGLVQFARVRAALVLMLLVGCVSLSIQGLEQVLFSMPASRAAYLKDPERMLAEQGIDAPPDSPRRKQFEDRLNSPEPFATFALANSLATLLSLGVVLNSGLLMSAVLHGLAKHPFGNLTVTNSTVTHAKATKRAAGKLNSGEDVAGALGRVYWLRLTALVSMLAVQLICLLLTRSRTAYLAVLVAAGVWLLLEVLRGKVRLSRRALQAGGGLVAAGLIIGLGWLLTIDRLVWSEAPKSISYRLEYWQATLQMIRDHVWTGVGLGNFQSYYPLYKLEQASEIIADPHNWLLDIAATLSLPIAVLILGWLGVTMYRTFSRCLSGASVGGLLDVVQDPSVTLRESRWQPDRMNQLEHMNQQELGRVEGRLVRALFGGAVVGGVAASSLLSLLGRLDFQIALTAWGVAGLLGCVVWWSTSHFDKLAIANEQAESASAEPVGSGATSDANLLAAVLVIVLCLLASGSWQASGIAVPFLMVVAMIWRTNLSGNSEASVHAGSHADTNLKNVASMASAAMACVAILIFIQQTWRPVTQGWVLDAQAASARSLAEQLRLIELAAEGDPMNADRRVQVLQLKGLQVVSVQDSATFAKEAEQLLEELKVLSPPEIVGYLRPKLAGQISFDLAAAAAGLGQPNKIYLGAAKGFYSQAVERYPSSVELLVQLAAVAAVDEDWQLAASSGLRGTEVSDRCPHLDKKLATQLIWLPLRPAGYESQTGYVPAEPLAAWLRSNAKAAPPQ